MQHPERSLLFPILLALLIAGRLLAQDEECAACHETELAEASIHVDLGCVGCHMDFDADIHPEGMTTDESELCAMCHDAGDALAESVHTETSCTGCHGDAHEILPADHHDSPLAPLRQVVTCHDCHGSERKHLIDGYLTSPHGHALFRAGLSAAPSCTSCHGAHDMKLPSRPESNISFERIPETCGECHTYVLERWTEESIHGKLWSEGSEEGPVCSTCHGSHDDRDAPGPSLEEGRLGIPEICAACHEDFYKSYRHSFHGEVTDLGYKASAVCSDCHTAHRNLPAADPRSTVHPSHLKATCGECHGEVNEGFLSFNPHVDPSDPESQKEVHLIWLFMTTLLIGVFSFFGLHDALWLQRLIVGYARGEWKHLYSQIGTGRDEPWVRRFSRVHVWTHALIVVSFLTLAATGLPLKFHDAAWAQAITAYPGSVALMRLLHRGAAILTGCYALLHVGALLHRGVVQNDTGIFWGWRSMIPNTKDLADLWHNVRYFLYQDKELKMDRFSYWEKFDYFAVFWGVPIIGGSGLVLWFPNFFTQFLPGWALNAAFIIHSDEALLATGFIFVFHFFHTHLRPEIIPFDPVMFTGSMPLSRFKEERSLEYERLQKSGELEKLFVEAPSEHHLRVLFFRAMTAVTIGVVLAIAIFWGLLAH